MRGGSKPSLTPGHTGEYQRFIERQDKDFFGTNFENAAFPFPLPQTQREAFRTTTHEVGGEGAGLWAHTLGKMLTSLLTPSPSGLNVAELLILRGLAPLWAQSKVC